MAEGRTETYDIGAAMFSVGEEIMPCPVIFGREGRYLLGQPRWKTSIWQLTR